jgi:opacity protein-like surface antigen
MIRNTGTALALLLSLGVTGLAQGAGHKWYVGVDYGESRLEGDDDNYSLVNRDFESETFALRIGYRFSRYFTLEAGYTDIGDFSATYLPPCPAMVGVVCEYDSTTSIKGIQLNSVFTWPVAEHFHVKGVLGATDREFKARIDYPNATTSWSDKTTVFSYGAGIAIPINERFEIDVDYVWYREVGLGLTLGSSLGVIDEAESQTATLGLRFRF